MTYEEEDTLMADAHQCRSTHEFVPNPENPKECSVCGRRKEVHKLTEKV